MTSSNVTRVTSLRRVAPETMLWHDGGYGCSSPRQAGSSTGNCFQPPVRVKQQEPNVSMADYLDAVVRWEVREAHARLVAWQYVLESTLLDRTP